MTRSSEDPKEAFEHLAYEIEMLYLVAQELQKDWTGKQVLQYALLESFAIHTRVLNDFFYSEKRKKRDDIIAVRFSPTWEKPPEKTPILRKASCRVNKEVAHLTYDRLWKSLPAKEWMIWETTIELLSVALKFFNSVDEKYFGHKCIELRKDLPGWIDRLSRNSNKEQLTRTTGTIVSHKPYVPPFQKLDKSADDDDRS